MTRTRYDQACRYLAKLDPIGLLCFLLGVTAELLRFRTWLDTRTLPWPGDPERTCDTVAWLSDADPAVEWALAVEFSLTPDETLFGRALVYLGQLWLEKRPTDAGGERFHVGAVVVNLTGHGRTSRDMQFGATGVRTTLGVPDRDMAAEDGPKALAGIASGSIAPCTLALIPLMQKGDDPAMIEQWLEQARLVPDPKRRGDYGGLALVFAEAAGRREQWKQALEGWNVIESQQVLEWIDQGRTEGRAEGEAKGRAEGEASALLRLLEKRFPPGPAEEVRAAIRAATDLQQLQRWFDLAVDADTLDNFRRAAGL